MLIKIEKTGVNKEAMMTHGDRDPLYWSITVIKGGRGREFTKDGDDEAEDYEIFHYLNQYWDTLSEEVQDRIFDCYQRIYDQINVSESLSSLDAELRVLVAELMSYHKLDKIEDWMMLKSDIQIPFGLREAFESSGRAQGTIEKTYLKHDYIKLVAMLLGIKAMLPVWVNYIEATLVLSGPTWKEFNAFRLLGRTQYYDCEAMRRLRLYITASINTPDNLASALVDGISREDFPDWLMAVTVIRKLVITDIRGIPGKKISLSPVLLGALHKYVMGRITHYDVSFAGAVREKLDETELGDRETKISKLECFKAREPMAAGQIAKIEVYFEDPINDKYMRLHPITASAYRYIAPFMDVVNVYAYPDQATGSVPAIKQWQRTIVNQVLRLQLPIRALSTLSKPIELNCMAVAAAVLWDIGYKDIAMLITSIDRGETNHQRPEAQKITKENLAALAILYPYPLRANKKSAEKGRNAGVVSIDTLTKDIVKYTRYSTLPLAMMEEVSPTNTRRMVTVSNDLRDRFAQLLVYLDGITNKLTYGDADGPSY